MKTAPNAAESRLIAELNDLLRLDHDAVEAYTLAIDLARSEAVREQLVAFRADHKRHIEELASLVREQGGLPVELPHATGALKMAVQLLGGLAGDDSLLLSFKAVEGQVRDKYARASRQEHYPAPVREMIRKGAADETHHYAWVEETLKARGLGEGTLPHGLATVVEGVHKLLADPLEIAEREVTRMVGEFADAFRGRGGSSGSSSSR